MMCACMKIGGPRGMLPQEIRCSEIASEAILEQRQSQGSSHMVCKVLHPVFGCITFHIWIHIC